MKNVLFTLLLALYGGTLLAQTSTLLIPIRQEGKWGYCTVDQKIVIPCQFDIAEPFVGKYALVGQSALNKNNYPIMKAAVIDTTGKIVLPFAKGLEWRRDTSNDPTSLSVSGSLANGIFSTYLPSANGNGILGLIDLKGKTTIVKGVPEFSDLYGFSEGLGLVTTILGSMKSGYITKTGALAIPVKFRGASLFSEGMASVSTDECSKGDMPKVGFINKTGQMVIPCKFLGATDFKEGLAAVTIDGDTWGFIDNTGKFVIQPIYKGRNFDATFSEGLARVQHDGKVGYIDKTGKAVIPFEWEDGNVFSEGLAAVRKGGKWGFIDKTGKEVIACQYEEDYQASYIFKNGFACVKKDYKSFAFIKPSGEALETDKIEAVWPFTALDGTKYYGFDDNGLIKVKRFGEETFLFMDKTSRIYGD